MMFKCFWVGFVLTYLNIFKVLTYRTCTYKRTIIGKKCYRHNLLFAATILGTGQMCGLRCIELHCKCRQLKMIVCTILKTCLYT
ncbi:hypothetical protein XENTR_v10011370 [Xenopus tropicalis]|nr:hypothetical protein XENTR_v10011370 [Xenopus tropicalis]